MVRVPIGHMYLFCWGCFEQTITLPFHTTAIVKSRLESSSVSVGFLRAEVVAMQTENIWPVSTVHEYREYDVYGSFARSAIKHDCLSMSMNGLVYPISVRLCGINRHYRRHHLHSVIYTNAEPLPNHSQHC